MRGQLHPHNWIKNIHFFFPVFPLFIISSFLPFFYSCASVFSFSYLFSKSLYPSFLSFFLFSCFFLFAVPCSTFSLFFLWTFRPFTSFFIRNSYAQFSYPWLISSILLLNFPLFILPSFRYSTLFPECVQKRTTPESPKILQFFALWLYSQFPTFSPFQISHFYLFCVFDFFF